ncbi:hypothetical protein ENBRE01_0546 [Enteropsectra breve]|nr:hypothetical protein ENBRE01_0546 [Enteropsectra breve]
MLDIVEILEEYPIKCYACEGEAYFRSFILKDTRPFKLITVRSCFACGVTETTQDDYTKLGYSVEIFADFTRHYDPCSNQMEVLNTSTPAEEFSQPEAGKIDNSKNLRRMAFVNNAAHMKIYFDGEVLFEFTFDNCFVDTIHGILLRGEEIFSSVQDEESKKYYENIREKLAEIIAGAAFQLSIEDKTGYSRICPFGVEYTTVQDFDLELFNDNLVTHIKTVNTSIREHQGESEDKDKSEETKESAEESRDESEDMAQGLKIIK